MPLDILDTSIVLSCWNTTILHFSLSKLDTISSTIINSSLFNSISNFFFFIKLLFIPNEKKYLSIKGKLNNEPDNVKNKIPVDVKKNLYSKLFVLNIVDELLYFIELPYFQL
eukprot:TRINITY_DN17981_c0_g1_i1.p2 TRINITY_DN17981_c0_g1~~TRINITY_DN17981_c0_g1_i1.p2  ORF type:complete len:112 (+),score=10.04 TRINITY_DN17981_c0_g1_i1:137-472(+)